MSTPQERWECPNCGTPLNIAALGIYAKVACPACGHIDHVHTILANYRLEGVLGLGGMSLVLRARDLVLERPLAIKLLNEFYRDHPERMARFEQECELMAKVRHENVVSVYSAGRVKGQFYIAMELINGRNLETLVREEGPMEPLRALNVLRQVALGLQAACKAGLLHRDMKPGNVLICDDGHAKVLDFGLSLGKRDADTEEIIWATPYYVPPETLMREPEDARTDIYALGMTLRHLLTGQENFHPEPEGIEEMLECKRLLPPMAELMPNLHEAYCDLVDHMTAYAPADRPDDYASLLEEIAEVRVALKAKRVGGAERFRRSVPLLVGAAATLALGCGAAVTGAWLATPQPELLYAMPASTLAWAERDTLSEAMALLQTGKMEEAAALLEQLANSEGEPAACAWAATHAALLRSFVPGQSDASFEMWERLEHHLTRIPASAGQELHAQMHAMQNSGAAPADKFLQAVHGFHALENALSSCQEAEAKKQLMAVRAALRGAGQAYAPLLGLLPQYEAGLEATQWERAADYYRYSLSTSLNMKEAARALALMEAGAEGDAARSAIAVQKEAFALWREAVGMMLRRNLLPAAGVTPGELPAMLAPLEQPALADELAVLLLMAQGDFKAAALHNPYQERSNSPEPFAVMMRDWLRRVK